MLDAFYHAFAGLLAFFYDVWPSYVVAIIGLTISVRLLLFPITAKQARSLQDMQRVQPELKRLQQMYKNDRQKLNEEMMKFYRENKINPLASCLPTLLQLPFFIVLYQVILGISHTVRGVPSPKYLAESSQLYQSIVADGGKVVSWGIDLSERAIDPHVSFLATLPFYLLIAFAVATGYYQQRQMTKRNPQAVQSQQAQLMGKIFPAMIGVFSLSIPAGVVVYFVVSNLWQIGQQALIVRRLPVPEEGRVIEAKPASPARSEEKPLKRASSTPPQRTTKPTKPASKPTGAKASKASAAAAKSPSASPKAGGKPKKPSTPPRSPASKSPTASTDKAKNQAAQAKTPTKPTKAGGGTGQANPNGRGGSGASSSGRTPRPVSSAKRPRRKGR